MAPGQRRAGLDEMRAQMKGVKAGVDDLEYRAILGTLLRIKRNERVVPSKNTALFLFDRAREDRHPASRGSKLDVSNPPPPPYSCKLGCETCFSQFFPAYKRVSDAEALPSITALSAAIHKDRDYLRRLAAEFAGSSRLRIHVDCNDGEQLLIFPFYQTTLLHLMQEAGSDLMLAERKTILRHVGEAIQEFHVKDWVHLDIKPDNILVQCIEDPQCNIKVTDAALDDFDRVFKLPPRTFAHTSRAMGNAMWRSPEAHPGMGMTKASDLFSFGLMCIYTLGCEHVGENLILHNYQALLDKGIAPEREVLVRLFSFFGPSLQGLLAQIGDGGWRTVLGAASRRAEEIIQGEPRVRFDDWGEELGTGAKKMISGMTCLDPSARTAIDQVLLDEWWDEIV